MTERQAPYLLRDMTRCAEYYRRGESSRWGAAFYAARVVGLRDGTTRELAQHLSVSDDTIYDLAKAAITWKTLRQAASVMGEHDVFRAISECRRHLTWSHFAEAGKLAKRFDLSPRDLFAMLNEAAKDGTPVKAMVKLITDEQDDAPAQDWHIIVKHVVNKLLDLATNADVDKSIALWAGKSAAAFEKLEVGG